MNPKWILFLVLAFISPIAALFFGASDLSNAELIQCISQGCQDPVNNMIFWEVRAPRVLVGFLVGAGLAVAGATLQNVTRNGLADP
uniref:iron chelate uptake ABC transporter family permease subunit n=1 Tax=uncultured Paraglaciecola sp. TaxID=1765024 RepID=UPI0026357110